MRLYTTGSQWAGTQADAKKLGKFVEVNVPTDKQGLLEWLNKMHWNDLEYMKPVTEPVAPPVKSIVTHRESAWHNINRVAEEAPLSELTTAMNIIMLRIQEHLEEGVK